ncbi:hypothetical protein [Ostreibacterium oceani]|uniref:Uncharacterized protein n=1 Tax=Ostreibacterium oceani TaxID=2654998 RepID=A0A6N7EX02_9GAMM|nr:hypothetical protein [Ostreibacterium oceani]MPV85657.1 hypothetical protein [Ostreibacterium oceani]
MNMTMHTTTGAITGTIKQKLSQLRVLRRVLPLISLTVLVLFGQVAQAQIPTNANRTIFLPQGPGSFGTPMNVTYHPGFDQYYASSGGFPSAQASVYDENGNIVNSIAPINIDVRSWNFNANSGLLEVVTFNAVSGGTGRGLIESQLDGSGFYTGGTSTLLPNMPGNDGQQTMPAYDSGNNVFYSRNTGNTVNVVSRVDGSLSNTITLDTAAAGIGTLSSYSLGFSEPDGWLIVLDSSNNTAVIFDLSGAYVGTSILDISVPFSYGMGFTNGQLFVWDASRNGWQGYGVGVSEVASIPTMPWLGLVFLASLLGFVGFNRRIKKSH